MRLRICALPALALAALLSACALPTRAEGTPQGTLAAYTSEAELKAALNRWRERSQQRALEQRRMPIVLNGTPSGMPAPPASPAPPVFNMPQTADAKAMVASSRAAAPAAAAAESITNNQTAGVDEGGIVKRAGEHLVILRRGRLFTVKVGGDELRPVSTVPAYAPNADPRGAWYDELLVEGRTVVVVGFSYARGGTEIGLFDLADNGSLSYRATYHLRGNDYYSSRNYASRLMGRQLIFYTPVALSPWGSPTPTPWQPPWPAWRRWDGAVPSDFERILPATRIYRSDDDFEPGVPLSLHTVVRCDLERQPLQCESSAVLGPAGRVFYVSQSAVWVWAGATTRAAPGTTAAALFRVPLDGGAPSGIKTVGMPIDQMSFLEEDGHLNVLLRQAGAGEAMGAGERGGRGSLALLRLPISALGDGRGAAAREAYRLLPGSTGWALHNRFVGDWLLWGGGGQEGAHAVRYAGQEEAQPLSPGHSVQRIEALGSDALLVGPRGSDLVFSAVRLSSRRAELAGQHVQEQARQGETRSHGFFYRPDAQANESGLLALPLQRGGDRGASVVFLRQRALQFSALGELAAERGHARDDGCVASCVDWYGNARPIFTAGRIFALMGYELVEGRLDARGGQLGGRLSELRRVDFSPAARAPEGRPSPFP